MEFSELVRARRSIRRYQEKPVPKELLRELLETACWAPSGDNRQPWYFLALTEPREIDRLKGTMERVSVEIEEHLEGIFQGKHPEVVREEQRFLRSVSSAPVCVLVFLQEDYEARDVAVESAAAATQTLLLAAHDKGLGACWVNAATILGYGPVIRDAFAPEKGEFLSLVTLGYSDAYPLAPKRKSGRFDIR